MSNPTRTLPSAASVIVVGAGPVGLAAAITLLDARVDVLLLDRQAEGANTSRACVVHARTLEVLDELAVAGELHAKGVVVPTFTIHDGASTLARVDFGGLPTAYRHTLMVPQQITEAVLLARLRSAGGDVARPYRVTGITDDGTGVTVTVADADGATHGVRAAYVIGADGMHSTVREQAGIGFTGDTYANSFVLADVRPAGGQGMNTGIQDAVALGRLLARIVAGEPDSVLDTYETTRRPVAVGVVAFTDRMTRMATLRHRPARLLRNTAIRALGSIPAVRAKLAYQLAELANR